MTPRDNEPPVTRRGRRTFDEERALVSCAPLKAVFEAVEREGQDAAELLVGVSASREQLLNRRRRVHWDDFRRVIENATRDWSDEQIEEFGRSVTHSKSQRPFALIAKQLFSVADFYRAVFSPRTGYGPSMFPCMDSKFAQLGEDVFEASLTLHDEFAHCPAFFAITKGNIRGIPEVLGSPPAEVTMETTGNGARFEIRAQNRSKFLARLRSRITQPFRAREMATELQEAHASLRSRFDALQDALLERERAEEALRESEERNRTLVENVGDAFFVIDQGGRFVDVNARACESLGLERGELVGMSMFDIEEQWDEARFSSDTDQVVDGQPISREGVHRRRDGSSFPVEVRGTWVRSTDGSRRFYGLARDVTEVRQAQEERELHAAQLRRSQKLEALGTLSSGIMHDFNNLLQAMYGHTELALNATPEGSPARENLDHVLQACKRGEQIAHQILTFSKASEHDRRPTEIAAIVREGLQLMKATIPTTVEIRSEVGARGALVMADGGQVQQVLMNLCMNAAHAMEPDGGTLEVSLDLAELSATESERYPALAPGQQVCLTVRDEGCGMSPEILDRIFDPFFTTKDVDRGTGLGLSVVHGIMTTHGGAIDVVSKPSEGTEVRVFFPRHEMSAAQQGASPTEATIIPRPPLGSGRILLVDDDPAVTRLLELSLSDLGYDVDAFTESDRALARFRENPHDYDLVITDQTMPAVTGLDLAKRMKAIRPNISIVLISGMGNPADPDEIRQAGVLEVLPKPFTTRELAEVLTRNLDTAGN